MDGGTRMDTIRNDIFGKVEIQNLLIALEEKLLQLSCHTMKRNRTRILKNTSRREGNSGKKLKRKIVRRNWISFVH
jgi:hypothetical protein